MLEFPLLLRTFAWWKSLPLSWICWT